jgi:hypothetical protein
MIELLRDGVRAANTDAPRPDLAACSSPLDAADVGAAARPWVGGRCVGHYGVGAPMLAWLRYVAARLALHGHLVACGDTELVAVWERETDASRVRHLPHYAPTPSRCGVLLVGNCVAAISVNPGSNITISSY